MPRYHGAIENDMIVYRAANPDDRFMIEGPSLDRGGLNRVKEGKANHDVSAISVGRTV